MDEVKRFVLVFDVLTVVFAVVGVFLVNSAYAVVGVVGYRLESVSFSVYLSLVSVFIGFVGFLFVVFYTWRALGIMGDSPERFSALFFFRVALYLFLLYLVLLMGLSFFVATRLSTAYFEVFGFRFYFYSDALLLYSILVSGFGVNLYLFEESQGGDFNLRRYYWTLVLYFVFLLVHIFPENNYGLGSQKFTLDIRPYTDGVVAVFILIVLFIYIVRLLRRLRGATDNLVRFRLKMFLGGNFALLLTLLFVALDSLSGVPFSYWSNLMVIFSMIGVVLYYIAVLMPSWATRFAG